MEFIHTKYGGRRKKKDKNNALYFCLNNQEVRVFGFKNMLDINDCPLGNEVAKESC